jgi:CheY-like chemotaxis protein
MDPVSPTTARRPDGTSGPRPDRPAGRGVDILLVEDNPADIAITRQVLRRNALDGHLTVARDGEEALALLAGPYRPDLVLLDLNMPRMGGLEVLEAIKGDPGLCPIPVIVLTSSVADQDVERAYAGHANAYIRKPVDLDDLSRIIAAIDQFWCSVAVLPGSVSGVLR